MAAFTTRALYVAALGVCATAALRPGTLVERGLDVVLTPVRALAEVAAPIGLLRAREVKAAERRVEALRAGEEEQRRALGADQRRFVLPRDDELRRERAFVIAEVTGRVARDADRLVVRRLEAARAEDAPIAAGMPVAVGDHFIGRVHAVSLDGARATVDLITRRDVFVGAALGEDARLVVGGLVRDRARPELLLLAVRTPSTRELAADARVRVDESLAGDTPFAGLADRFELGRLVTLEGGRNGRELGVRSPIDFRAGVFQVAIVTPPRAGSSNAAREVGPDVLADGRWARARALSRGDPSGLHEGLRLDVGSLHGVRPGAALVAGARLLGRIGGAGPLDSRARLLGDPGLAIPAVARVSEREEPLILGTLVSLGRAPGARGKHRVLLHWDEGWPLGEGELDTGAVPARLFTGAGAFGVPPGLVLGDTRLPRCEGPVVLELELEVDPRALAHVRVRRVEPSGASQAGDAP